LTQPVEIEGKKLKNIGILGENFPHLELAELTQPEQQKK